MTFNLIKEPWIPVRTVSGLRKSIAPWEITERYAEDPFVALDAPRADFTGALIQFLIGLVQTAAAPRDHGEWLSSWHNPPRPDELHSSFSSVAHAFDLDGDGPRFMQDLELSEGEKKGVEALLIESPGEKTVKDNTDHFIKAGRVAGLCHECCATALLTLQTNAPSGGAGHRTSLRGGGPLTTLVIGDHDRLWQTVWLNTLTLPAFLNCTGANPQKTEEKDQFPWLAPTRTSEPDRGYPTTPEDVHPSQVFWGMPRRIRLDFSTARSGSCDLCGAVTDNLVQRYFTKNYGINYEGHWRHPLSPHYSDNSGAKLPRHAQPGGVSYRHWLGLVQEDTEINAEPAYVVHEFRTLRQSDGLNFGLWAFGYDMDNMKARCWYETVMPLPGIIQETRENYDHETARFIRAADQVVRNLRSSVKTAWFERPSDVKGDFGFLDKKFWQATESDFYAISVDLRDAVGSNRATDLLRVRWHKFLCSTAMCIFDELVAGGPIQDANPKRIALARNDLDKWNRGKRLAAFSILRDRKLIHERSVGPFEGEKTMLAKGPLNFSPDTAASAELQRWWQSLEEARGDRARLRRCRELVSVVFISAYYRLRSVLLPLGRVDDEALAAVAGILAHVKNHVPGRAFAEQMAQPKRWGASARVSGLRFRRLLQFQNHCELYPALIRAVCLLDGAVNLHSLASSTYSWNDPVRKQWVYDYYGTAPTED